MAPHPIPLPCALAFLPPSHRDATTPSPCWAPHFMTQERIMLSNSTPSKPRLSPAAIMSDDTLSAVTPPLHCASILQPVQPVLKFSLLSFRPSLLQFVSIVSLKFAESRKSDLSTCVCVFTFFLFCLCVLIDMNFSSKSLFAIWSLSPQRFHYYFLLSIVS